MKLCSCDCCHETPNIRAKSVWDWTSELRKGKQTDWSETKAYWKTTTMPRVSGSKNQQNQMLQEWGSGYSNLNCHQCIPSFGRQKRGCLFELMIVHIYSSWSGLGKGYFNKRNCYWVGYRTTAVSFGKKNRGEKKLNIIPKQNTNNNNDKL